MTDVVGFPGAGERHPAPAPSETGSREAFAVLGGCADGLMFGYLTTEIPPGGDPKGSCRHLVEQAFDGVLAFRFGVVIGGNPLA